jgi:multidrug efflux pump subunit AcrB
MITTGMGGVASPNNSNSPAAIEAQRWAARKKKEDKEADESIRRFNARLKALIREGKEALGTTVSVHDENEDGDEVEF